MLKPQKNFVGPQLRQLRREHGQTQAAMAGALGLSPAYINLLENNQRSLSVRVLLRLSEVYGVDWRDLLKDDGPTALADLRNALQDPVFGAAKPDLEELRAALDHCPNLARSLLSLHKNHRAMTERLLSLTEGDIEVAQRFMGANPETVVHDLFRAHRNHFDVLERAAEDFRQDEEIETGEFYGTLSAASTSASASRSSRLRSAQCPTRSAITTSASGRSCSQTGSTTRTGCSSSPMSRACWSTARPSTS